MGVPSFYRWLVNKYPKVVVSAIEDKGECTDTTSPNPNGIEFDHLYLDMNGIIHPCFHPDDSLSPPTNFREVFNSIFEYIDRLFGIVRPRKLLYLAVDGVAPRAKMNQQRSRRFRTAKDKEIAEEEEERLRRQFEMEGKQLLPKLESDVEDSNIITPGTEFMYELSKALQEYVCSRLKNDVGWKDIKVILSDANVPGEGEHKIMSFIRQQRTLPNYNPNTHHCLYGLDADLIMLALATHEVHFSILREDVLILEQQPICQTALQTTFSKEKPRDASLIKKPYQFLNVWILREYLELDMKISDLPENLKEIDMERIIDDFVLMCSFVGNDFLPHMPTLEIHEGAIDLLMTVYKKEFKKLGGYLVDMQRVEDNKKGEYVKLNRVEKFILLVGQYEDKIFKKRLELRERKLRRLLSDQSNANDKEEDIGGNMELNTSNSYCAIPNRQAPSSIVSSNLSLENLPSSRETENLNADNAEIVKLKNTKELKEKLKECIRSRFDLFKNDFMGRDKVKFGTVGSKERYYKEKFSAESREDIESTRKAIVQKYTEGLLWVLIYYFSGVPSWTWFYPYHYGPFASDLKGMSQVKVKFQKGSPFKPFDQLMAVLPPRSAHALPKAYQELMTNEQSNIIEFYPSDFDVDTDGKRYMWQGICKLSFIEEERLLLETRKLEKELQDKEATRNVENVDQLLVRSSNNLGSQILSIYQRQVSGKQNGTIKEKIDSNLSGGLNGIMRLSLEGSNLFNSTYPGKDHNVQADSILYVGLEIANGGPSIPRPLYGTEPPYKTITEDDIEETQLWHECQGNKSSSRYQFQERERKSMNGGKFASSNQSFEMTVHKCVGSGWGAGRGKLYPSTDSEGYVEPSRRILYGNGGRATWAGSTSASQQKVVSSTWVARKGNCPSNYIK
ncbi:hypothetical protein L1049_012785 [Liquidambar formosana]|uniref:5'-3' exoribonuclease n=1 Tax=Liquidambar formosana TaxID=63359 RepID=A0AAP0RLV1_LIQFO